MFWRDTGTNEDEDDVEAREGACSMETAMFWGGCRREGDGQEAVTLFVRAVAAGRQGARINRRRLLRNCSGRARPARRDERGFGG